MPDTVAMRERPIIFSGPMIPALISGTKTQTRRVVKPQPPHSCLYVINGAGSHALCLGIEGFGTDKQVYVPPTARSTDHRLSCPYGEPGDRLWVKETWAKRADSMTAWKAGPHPYDVKHDLVKWRSPLFMPRGVSRITLEITDIRVERLQQISEADARAEGVDAIPLAPAALTHRTAFAGLWDRINGKRPGCSWADDPWVWCLSFRRLAS